MARNGAKAGLCTVCSRAGSRTVCRKCGCKVVQVAELTIEEEQDVDKPIDAPERVITARLGNPRTG